MGTRVFLITGHELAEHSQKNQDLVLEMFTIAHQTYPELTIPELIEYTQSWVKSLAEDEEDWDYVPGLNKTIAEENAPAEEVEPGEVFVETEEEESEYLSDIPNDYDYNNTAGVEVSAEDEENVSTDDEAEPELQLEEISYEVDDSDVQADEDTEEFVLADYDSEPAYADTESVEKFTVGGYTVTQLAGEEPEEPEELLEVAEDEDATADFFNPEAPAVISRQRRYKGLLSEAGKLDRF